MVKDKRDEISKLATNSAESEELKATEEEEESETDIYTEEWAEFGR